MTINIGFPTNWFKEHNISSHTIAGVLIAASTLYTTDTTVFNMVNSLLAAHPKELAALGTLVAVILKYSGSHSTQGQVALIANTPPVEVAQAVAALKQTAVVPQTPELQNVIAAAAAKETPKA